MENDAVGFRTVLDLCDELSDISDRLSRRRGALRRFGEGVLREKRQKMGELRTELCGAPPEGLLGELAKRYSLSQDELLVAVLLLSRRIRRGNKGLSGRDILSMLHDSAYDIVRGMAVLSEEGNLRRSGMMVASEAYRGDVLEMTFRLSDEVFYAVVDRIGADADSRRTRPPQRPFAGAREHLLEMGRITSLYRRRAATLFPVEAQDFFAVDGDITLDEIEYRIEAEWDEIEARLLLTPEYEEFPLVRLERIHALSREELVIIVSLFFVELISPAPYLVAGDLVKLVSRDEEDLIAKRGLLTAAAPLVKSGIVMLDEGHGVHRKITTFDAYLADWVVERLTGPRADSSAITTDTQIDVHEFLKGLSKAGEPE